MVKNITELDTNYNDRLRSEKISDVVAELLRSYNVVIRCDVDEFIVPGITIGLNLAEYVERNELSHVTARGINVVELADESALSSEDSIISQRKYGFRSSPMNKTCLVSEPVRWAQGFHGASVAPRFAGLYNFHLRYADLKGRIAWHKAMLDGLTAGSTEYNYFLPGAEALTNLQGNLRRFSKIETETEAEFDTRFLNTVWHNVAHNIHQGDFFDQKFLVQLSSIVSPESARF
jgi:hypothetical protein